MTTRQALGRHRATPVRTNPLESISKAVASNAGSVGRQAAVIAAASGLVLTLGVPAQGDVSREASAVPVEGLSAERVAVKAVSVAASKAKDLNIERAAFTSKPAPAPVVVAVSNEVSERSNDTAPVTRSSSNSDAMAPVTRSNRDSTPKASEAPKVKSDSMNTANLSGIAATAAKYVGVPYVWGGNTPSGWDCSGFVKYVYAKHGINIARGTSAIRASGQFVRTSSPKPGDLVFQNGGGHVGIYLGGGKMIGAQNPTVDTMLHDVSRNPLYGYYTLKG
ncbi:MULTISPECIES: C40 family peptidase [Paeniglutamicibacter]|uniref:Cell wall-associated NlpC family hydrolase n=1 Tax=Paeniglutamicibacter sulfureus TaxID=43666 RepID=A0ABU2BGT6_9MICC|nr:MULTISPECIES: C40 family peptidase [Paeniglutamicibacter]MCV9993229.1 C40 family peptidase [Paeniglutamicibacter sp. ZC-3]MDR7357862.1 cell wall-associated NlpC family hydrolase [Paeniglutamicibacter sulfureus]